MELRTDEDDDFQDDVEEAIRECQPDFLSGFVAESPDKLRRLPQYYAALAGTAPFPPVSCNAPYMSVVIEADGAVRPCFFHQVIGSTRREALTSIVHRNLPAFRETLSFETNPICTRCVCSMRAGRRNAPWPWPRSSRSSRRAAPSTGSRPHS